VIASSPGFTEKVFKMRVRMPKFDFTQSRGRWMPKAGEFSHILNANSVVIPYLEPFLNRVMARARAEIKGQDPESQRVREDISTFIKQESCHYTIHGAFNEMLLREGYTEIPEIQKRVKAHYDRLLRTKSLPFLVAYCEGFESLVPPTGASWFNGEMDRMTEGAEPNAMNMWRWHIMEEFEHRTVCHDAYKALGGNDLLRAYGFFYQLFSLGRMVGWAYRHMLAVDRARMTPEDAAKSKRNSRRTIKSFFGPIFTAMPRILSPSYSPRQIPDPKGWASARDDIETHWMGSSDRAAQA
jgi:predicted metal-dependent hydrolase